MESVSSSDIVSNAPSVDRSGSGQEVPFQLPQMRGPEPPANSFSSWLQYAYFLRSPLLGLLSLPVLCVLDHRTGLSALTRGIVTMSRAWQAFYASFFIAALMNACLICAKNIVRNGKPRFSSEPPTALSYVLLGPSTPDGELLPQSTLATWLTLLVAQLPALLTLLYVGYVTGQEHETNFYIPLLGRAFWHIWILFLGGLFASFLFWYGVTLFYLWIYPNYPPGHPRHRAAALLLPSTLPGMKAIRDSAEPRVAKWISISLRPLTWLSHDGYSDAPGNNIWEFHALAGVALGWFLLTYLFLYPLTAPIVLNRTPIAGSLLALTIGAVLLWGTRECKPKAGAASEKSSVTPPLADAAPPPESSSVPVNAPAKPRVGGSAAKLVIFAIRLTLVIAVATFLALLLADAHEDSVRLENSFPVLASVTVILIFLQWLLSGASFFFDRFRLPVFTTLLAYLFLSKFALGCIDQDHYFEAYEIPRVHQLETPASAIAARIKKNPNDPYIIVTASGGGIQAAAWTAEVMAQFESAFATDASLHQAGYTFHDHLLLASGVSGGSVGLMPFLLEYTAPAGTRFSVPDYISKDKQVEPTLLSHRLTLAPACSSLEAVAWGLEYYDLQRLLLTIRIPILQTAANGASPDRTWALSQAFNRNLTDRDCGTDPSAQEPNASFSLLPKIRNGENTTLTGAAALLRTGDMPAFTFNTTVVETGGRFLLSNYGVPPTVISPGPLGTDFLPAESFLQAYGQEPNCALTNKNCFYADLSLATAARLSATFPGVSSATRIPLHYVHGPASHFVDGGYFDNDGTGSVTEFLYSALHENAIPADARILLIEVRDGDDLDPTVNQDDLGHQDGSTLPDGASKPKPWTTSNQLFAPVEALWQSGHVSVTRRNRRELCLLETAYGPQGTRPARLEIHHVVLGIKAPPTEGDPDKPKSAPLSWKLTHAQEQYIEQWTRKPVTQQTVQSAVAWVKDNLQVPRAPLDKEKARLKAAADSTCTAVDQTYMRRSAR